VSDVNLHLMGRFGNQLFQWVFCRAYCAQYGHQMHCDPWVGEQIFEGIECPRITQDFPHRNEDTANGDGEIGLEGYFQNQQSLIYTRTQAKAWLKFRPEVLKKLITGLPALECIVRHVRQGDYVGSDIYPVVGFQEWFLDLPSYLRTSGVTIVEADEHSVKIDGLPDFLPDFWRLMNAKILYRANSSFSYWAAVLADESQEVWSPRIDGLKGGIIHDEVPWERGNHCRLADLPFISDLHLAP